MPKADVLNWERQKVSQVDLQERFFSQKLNKALLSEIVLWQRASKRSGTHKVKSRGEVRGGGRKPFRQKGTGNARQGSIRSPLLEGGGVAHGPKPRSYAWHLSKKNRQKALQNALSYLFSEKRLIFVESMNSPEGKTKELKSRLKKQAWEKALLVDQKKDEKFQRACKNLKQFKFISAQGLNVYDLLKFDRAVFTPSALKTVCEKWGGAS